MVKTLKILKVTDCGTLQTWTNMFRDKGTWKHAKVSKSLP